MVRSAFRNALRLAVFFVAAASVAQTFDVNGSNSSAASPPSKKQAASRSHDHSTTNNESGMGWGSGIEVAREARAAQIALQHGDAREATEHAQRAVNSAPQNPDLWFTLAYAARLSGQYATSVDAYRHGLTLKPTSVQGLSGLAQTYARMGRNAEAQQTLEQVLAANPKSDQDLQLAGELLLTTDPKRALGYLQRSEAIKASPRNELLLARAYDRAGDGDQAHAMLERARRSAPNNPEVLRAVASYYRDTGHYQEAVRLLEGLHSKDANAYAELAYSYTLAGNAHAAAQNYGEAASRAPRNIEIQLSAAQAMLNAGDFGKATALLNHAETLNPEHYRLYALRGRLDTALRRNSIAIREYEAALQHLPEGVPEGFLYPISLRVDLAEAYRDAGDGANAERVTKDAATAIGTIDLEGAARPEFLRLRAVIELDAGKVDSAEKDLQQALHLEPRNPVLLLNYANLLRTTERNAEAMKTYQQALAIDSSNGAALGALGFLSRETGNFDAARGYFLEFVKKHTDDYVPYLALGDLYSENRHFQDAQESYEQAFMRSPDNPLIVSGAMNAALEAHHTAQAKQWLAHASETVRQDPQVMREHERYLTMTGNYAESAALGYQIIEKLPKDREAVDYLAYDLLFLKRLDEAMKIVDRFEPVLGDDRDLPLISGYVNAQHDEYEPAVRDFTHALQIDPKMAVGYMNRGYVYNDMRLATKAEQDFRSALALNPQYGEAHLGLAYALVQLRRPSPALKEAEVATRLLPDSESLHLVKAEAYRQRAMLTPAEGEYKKALKLNPNHSNTYIALANVQYRAHKFDASAATLKNALAVAPNNSMILAQLGRSYAKLGRSSEAMQAITSAERAGGKDYKILLVAADALRILNRRDQAMTTYEWALESSDEDRLQVRLALGQLFAEEGKAADAQQQVAIGFAEARVAPVDVTTADDYLNAASILMSIHEYPLAQRLYGRAQALGADETSVALGMANAALALGDTRSAQVQLASLPDDPDRKHNYDFLVSQGNVYRQLGKDNLALSNFARAHQLDPEDPAARTAVMDLAEEEGRPLTDHVGMSSGVRVNPVFEDDNIYQLDARLLGLRSNAPLLPPPRRSIETFTDSRFQFRPNSFPPIQGFVAERNAQGSLSFPSQLLIQDRNTFDTIFNVSVAPVVQLGNVKLNIMPGLQYTIRRDTLSPQFMNQNLFRQFVYVASSPIGDWLTFSGNLIREAGPFTDQALHSRDFSGSPRFSCGPPLGKNRVADRLQRTQSAVLAIGKHFLSGDYRVLSDDFLCGAGTSVRYPHSRVGSGGVSACVAGRKPGVRDGANSSPTVRCRCSFPRALGALCFRGMVFRRSFHAYDSVTSNFVLNYTRERGFGRSTGSDADAAEYPLTFSFGFGQQSFYNFSGHARTQIIPVAQFRF